jgi:acyl-CoA dehydrogenase
LSLAEAREDFGERAETLRPLTDSIRGFARKELVGAEKEVEETGEIPERIVSQLKELGLFGMTVPEAEEYGGLGLSVFEISVVFEVTYVSRVFPSYFGTTNGVGPLGLINFGTPEQKVRYLPAIASRECMASFCLTEPDAGSDAVSLITRAVRDGDSYVINGTNRFTTNAAHGGLFTVFAQTERRKSAPPAFPRFWSSEARLA